MGKQWWKTSGAVLRISIKIDGLTLSGIRRMLPDIRAAGFGVIELLAPYHGGVEYHGLDGMDFAAVDPAIGTEEDFRELVSACHDAGLRLIVFLNLGYSAIMYPPFRRAQKALGSGEDCPEVDWFIWSDDLSRTFPKPDAPWFLQDASGDWVYSHEARKYFYCKWFGANRKSPLPQLNFESEGWRRECRRILAYWRDMGIDGAILDAVNWYMGCNWQVNEDTLVAPLFQNGEIYLQPEGAGGFDDDPLTWIQKGHYNSVQDYSLNLWWSGADALGACLASGNPERLERRICGWRDRIVSAGGVTYASVNKPGDLSPGDFALSAALLVAVGEIVYFPYSALSVRGILTVPPKVAALLQTQQANAALAPAAARLRLHTDRDFSCYAMLRGEPGNQMMALLNFAREEADINITLPNGKVENRTLAARGYLFEKVSL